MYFTAMIACTLKCNYYYRLLSYATLTHYTKNATIQSLDIVVVRCFNEYAWRCPDSRSQMRALQNMKDGAGYKG